MNHLLTLATLIELHFRLPKPVMVMTRDGRRRKIEHAIGMYRSLSVLELAKDFLELDKAPTWGEINRSFFHDGVRIARRRIKNHYARRGLEVIMGTTKKLTHWTQAFNGVFDRALAIQAICAKDGTRLVGSREDVLAYAEDHGRGSHITPEQHAFLKKAMA